MARYVKWPGIVGLALIALAGCTLHAQRNTAQDTARDDLTARLADAQQAQAAALNLWDRLIFGEAVSCQESIPVPEPVTLAADDLEAHPQAGAIQARLNEAIASLRMSSELWDLECAEGRVIVPLATAKEGRATALAASAPLDEAATLLAARP